MHPLWVAASLAQQRAFLQEDLARVQQTVGQVYTWCIHELKHPIVAWHFLSTLLWQWLPVLIALTVLAAAAFLAKRKIEQRRVYVYMLLTDPELADEKRRLDIAGAAAFQVHR